MRGGLGARVSKLEGKVVALGASLHVAIPSGWMDDAAFHAWEADALAGFPPGERVIVVRFVDAGGGRGVAH